MYYGSGLGAVMAMGAAITTVVFLIGLGFYILKSLGLYALANNRGIENPWLAWIPVADLYIMGMLVGEMDLFGVHIDNLGLWYPVGLLVGVMLSMIPIIGIIFTVALLIFNIAFIYKLFEMYTPSAALFTVLSILLGLLPVFIFVIRDNELMVSPPAQAAPPDEL